MKIASMGRRSAVRWLLALGLSTALLGGAWAAPGTKPTEQGKGWEYYLTGTPAALAPEPPRTKTTVLMGGGPDVDAAFKWMMAKAGGGDFVVIRASGADGYNQYLYDMGGVSSVQTFVIKTRGAANDQTLADRVSKASALFIAGGDQYDYISLWKSTALQVAIETMMKRNIPIGGTSAGLMVLGQIDFSAANGTIYSAEAMSDPYSKRITLDTGFLSADYLQGTVTDAHLDTRDRMGRLMAFMARTIQDEWVSVANMRGIGVDVETALLVDDGKASLVGTGAAYFLKPLIAPTVCEPKTPLTFRSVGVDKLNLGGSFDLRHWRGASLTAQYHLSVETGVLTSDQPGGSPY